jgi:hypothetical protein
VVTLDELDRPALGEDVDVAGVDLLDEHPLADREGLTDLGGGTALVVERADRQHLLVEVDPDVGGDVAVVGVVDRITAGGQRQRDDRHRRDPAHDAPWSCRRSGGLRAPHDRSLATDWGVAAPEARPALCVSPAHGRAPRGEYAGGPRGSTTAVVPRRQRGGSRQAGGGAAPGAGVS